MRVSIRRGRPLLALAGLAAAGAALIAGCGSSSVKPTKLSMAISEQGKAASFKVPKMAKGGLVDLSFKNDGKGPHGVQLVQYTGSHTAQQALKAVGGNSNKTPDWIKAQGGTDVVPGGQSSTATLNLPAGNYLVVDSASFGGPSSGPPATAEFKLTSGSIGDLPSTAATVTANHTGKDKYAWQVTGLKSGKNDITFNSKGKEGIHLILAVPVKGKAPPLSKIKKDVASNGPPPKWADFQNLQSAAVLDGGSSQTLSFELPKSGQYVLFCPLHDRDGKGKPHDQEGLLKVVTVK
jgi:hypothetical protein